MTSNFISKEAMDCTALLKRSEQQLLAGNVSTADAAAELIDCFPQVCEQVFGTADFDLAGKGVFISTTIQAVLFILFGTAQAYISHCLPSRASIRTKLTIARFQSVSDTIYATGSFFSLVIFVAAYIRTSQDGITGLEKSITRDVIDSHQMLQNLAMATYWIQKTPAKIKRGARAWNDGLVYLFCQGLGIIAWNTKSRLDKIPLTGAQVAPRLCASLYDYPHLHTGVAAAGWNPLLFGALICLVSIAVGIFVAIALPRLYNWSKRILESRVLLGTLCVLFTAGCLFCTGFTIFHLHLTRKDLEGTPGWDLAQIFALLVWILPVWHIVLATLVSVVPEKKGAGTRGYIAILAVENTYASWFEPPTVVEDKPEKSNAPEEKQVPQEASPPQPDAHSPEEQYDEKARLVDDSVPRDREQARSPSPGSLV